MKNRASKQVKLFMAHMLFILFSVIQIQAETQTAAPAWGYDPVTGTLLQPGIAVHTLGTLATEKVAGDGDYSLKLFDTRSPDRSVSRPVNSNVNVYIHHN